jgi:hypothetical protein
MRDNTRRELLEQKREIKRAGGKRRRRILKQSLIDNPEEAHEVEGDFGRYSSAWLNGLDQDATRNKRLHRGSESNQGSASKGKLEWAGPSQDTQNQVES